MFPNGMNSPLTSVGPRPNVPGSPPYAFGGPMAGNTPGLGAGPWAGGQLPAGFGGGGNFPGGPVGQDFRNQIQQTVQPWLDYGNQLRDWRQGGRVGDRPGFPGMPQFGGFGQGQGLSQLLANRSPQGMAQTLQGMPQYFNGPGTG